MGVALPRIPAPALPPLWRESRLGLEARALLRDPVWRGDGVPAGDGRPVLLIPGFMAGDASLAAMTGWLRRCGFHTRRAGMRTNWHCSGAACARLEERLEAIVDVAGRPATIIGQSRGGVLAKALAMRRPDLVSGVVALGSPTLGQLRVHPFVLAQVGLVAALGTSRVPGLLSVRCLRGACCAEFREAIRAPLPDGVRYVSIYSRSDGIVDWRACLDPGADHVEVRASHCGMAMNAAAYRAIAAALAPGAGVR
jgi:pimeloyl-ACP methyl ester carboxylesterase